VQDHASGHKTVDAEIAELLTEIAIKASAAILSVDFRKAGTRHKADDSPVTIADEKAQAAILEGLARALPSVPVVSEEAACTWAEVPSEFLLVDPLDGTAEFIAGRPEYTVNIALVRGETPVVGLVAAPALGLIWRGVTGNGAERQRFSVENAGTAVPIHTRPWPEHEPVAAVSRSHYDAASAAFLTRFKEIKQVEAGSALKFCRLAEGAIDVYPRLAPTFEWDVAAGHAVVVAAGGTVTAPDGGPVRFGRLRDGFRVPGFIAWGDPAEANRLKL
jgi:3'(2'), 5'-bisphosphate nucleotidase